MKNKQISNNLRNKIRPKLTDYQIIKRVSNLKPNLSKISNSELLSELKQRIEKGIIRLEPADNNYERGFTALNALNYDYVLDLSEIVKDLEKQGRWNWHRGYIEPQKK